MGSNQAESPLQSGTADEPTTRIAVDVRRFPWIRRLAADYAYNFPSVAPFFSGNPNRPRRVGACDPMRAGHTPRLAPELASIIARQQERRGAPARAARGGTPASRSARGRARHRSAGRPVRRSAVHAAESADGAEARRPGVAGTRRAGSRGVLDRRGRSRLERSPLVYGLR